MMGLDAVRDAIGEYWRYKNGRKQDPADNGSRPDCKPKTQIQKIETRANLSKFKSTLLQNQREGNLFRLVQPDKKETGFSAGAAAEDFWIGKTVVNIVDNLQRKILAPWHRPC